MDSLPHGNLIGDSRFDANQLLNELAGSRALPVNPPKPSRAGTQNHDPEMYKCRRQIEHSFARSKEIHPLATRNEDTDETFATAIHLIARVVAAT